MDLMEPMDPAFAHDLQVGYATISIELSLMVPHGFFTEAGLRLLLQRLDTGDLSGPMFDGNLLDVAEALTKLGADVPPHRLSVHSVDGVT